MHFQASDIPDFTQFAALCAAGQGALVWRVGAADLDTPVGVYLKLAAGQANSFLLESIEGGAARGRYSMIGLRPDLIWRCRDGVAEVNRAALDGDFFTPDARPVLESLRALIAETQMPVPDGLPPMAGGLFGYLGYDMVRCMEALPVKNLLDGALPEAILLRPTLFAVFDHVRDTLTLIAPVYPGKASTDEAWHAAHALLDHAQAALGAPLPAQPPHVGSLDTVVKPQANMPKAAFLDIVDRCKDYIASGDVFQVVPSQRFSAPFPLSPLALYRALRRINPAPFLFHIDFGGFALVGSSPEILVRLRDGVVTLRPLAGTRPRGATRALDDALERELLADPKELAEHLMLIDLGRNDIGRVAEPGSVRVTESFAIERFSHVMHISSTVEGKLRPELGALDALIAGFPAGTLSGAPKIRAMEIIEEMEPTRRGAYYSGCIGYFAANGGMDTCIALRTALVKDGVMHVQAGCGVVADSVPESEYEETRQKARALFRAAEEALRSAG